MIKTGIALLILLAILSQAPLFAQQSYLNRSSRNGAADQFGVNGMNADQSPAESFTPSRHHRWGQETGIGSSASQTTSATADSTPMFNYRPTSVSPAFKPVRSGINLTAPTFSERMSNPALSPSTVIMPPTFSLSGQINPDSYESGRPQMMSGPSTMLYGLLNSATQSNVDQSTQLDNELNLQP